MSDGYSSELPGFVTPSGMVGDMSREERVERAVRLLQEFEPPEGYYLAFSGGKDSCVIKALAIMAAVKFEAWYNQTTIDPPELIRFLKKFHADVQWNIPRHGNMMSRVATAPKVPPTRGVRWCCQEYKEQGGRGRRKIIGVRAAESPARKARWVEFATDMNGDVAMCPIVYWSDDDLWDFLHFFQIPYCELYDQGFSRLGCVGCPLASSENQSREFAKWPKFEANWKKAIIANWEKWHAVPNSKTGGPRYHAKFKSGEEFWQWWRHNRLPDYGRGDCQGMLLWTNEPGATDEELEELEQMGHLNREGER